MGTLASWVGKQPATGFSEAAVDSVLPAQSDTELAEFVADRFDWSNARVVVA